MARQFGYYPPVTEDVEKIRVLISLHKGVWRDELLDPTLFGYLLRYVLTRKEKEVVLLKIDGRSDAYIAHKFGVKVKSVIDYASLIKKKYRDNYDWRVDNKYHLTRIKKEVRDGREGRQEKADESKAVG